MNIRERGSAGGEVRRKEEKQGILVPLVQFPVRSRGASGLLQEGQSAGSQGDSKGHEAVYSTANGTVPLCEYHER